MAVTTVAADSRPAAQSGPGRMRGVPSRRSVPHLLLGLLLVTSCTAGAVLWSINASERRPALALARSIALGHTIEAADLREVEIAVDGGLDAIPASDTSAVIGQIASANLPAGTLLPRAALGTPPVSADDHAVAALAMQPGQIPPRVQPGVSVLVVLSADPNASTSTAAQPVSVWPGTVADVAPDANADRLVVSVELTEADARRVAAAPTGRLSVVLVSGGDR